MATRNGAALRFQYFLHDVLYGMFQNNEIDYRRIVNGTEVERERYFQVVFDIANRANLLRDVDRTQFSLILFRAAHSFRRRLQEDQAAHVTNLIQLGLIDAREVLDHPDEIADQQLEILQREGAVEFPAFLHISRDGFRHLLLRIANEFVVDLELIGRWEMEPEINDQRVIEVNFRVGPRYFSLRDVDGIVGNAGRNLIHVIERLAASGTHQDEPAALNLFILQRGEDRARVRHGQRLRRFRPRYPSYPVPAGAIGTFHVLDPTRIVRRSRITPQDLTQAIMNVLRTSVFWNFHLNVPLLVQGYAPESNDPSAQEESS